MNEFNKIKNKILKLDKHLEKTRLCLEDMPSRKRRASLNILYDRKLSEKRKLEKDLVDFVNNSNK